MVPLTTLKIELEVQGTVLSPSKNEESEVNFLIDKGLFDTMSFFLAFPSSLMVAFSAEIDVFSTAIASSAGEG